METYGAPGDGQMQESPGSHWIIRHYTRIIPTYILLRALTFPIIEEHPVLANN
jgi:hypothetical protein